jgi:hypothetical protein
VRNGLQRPLRAFFNNLKENNMPNMANITIKKADGTTDIVWAQKSPSAGDKVPAIWRSDTVGASAAHRPEFKVWTFGTPNGKQRVAKTTLTYPITVLDGTLTKVVGYCTQVTETKVFMEATDVEAGEVVNQGFNLLASALIKQAVKEGFAPT